MQKGNIKYSLELTKEKKQEIKLAIENKNITPSDMIAAYMLVYADLKSDKSIADKQVEQTIMLIQQKIDIFSSTLTEVVKEEEVL